MRIEANKHPAANHITDVLVNGVPLMRGTCAWVDRERGEACIYLTDGNGAPRIEDGRWLEKVITGAIGVRIPDEHKHLLRWGQMAVYA
jgi:hypothetical protein